MRVSISAKLSIYVRFTIHRTADRYIRLSGRARLGCDRPRGRTRRGHRQRTADELSGLHVVFVKATDNYEQVCLYSTSINIDNTVPVLKLEYPLTGSKLDNNLFKISPYHIKYLIKINIVFLIIVK